MFYFKDIGMETFYALERLIKEGTLQGFQIGEANQLIYQPPGSASFQLLIRARGMSHLVEHQCQHLMLAEALLCFSLTNRS